MSEKATCVICGEPMPPGEEMFKYHGYSGDCPKPPISRDTGHPLSAKLRSRWPVWSRPTLEED